jgi:hypothetical protein
MLSNEFSNNLIYASSACDFGISSVSIAAYTVTIVSTKLARVASTTGVGIYFKGAWYFSILYSFINVTLHVIDNIIKI